MRFPRTRVPCSKCWPTCGVLLPSQTRAGAPMGARPPCLLPPGVASTVPLPLQGPSPAAPRAPQASFQGPGPGGRGLAAALHRGAAGRRRCVCQERSSQSSLPAVSVV